MKKRFLFLIIGLGLSLASPVLAWTAPSGNPPDNNAASPINTSAIGQIKQGGLSTNGLLWSLNKFFVGAAGTMDPTLATDPTYVAQFNGTVKTCNADGSGCVALGAGSSGSSSLWTASGTSIYNSNTGNVGIGLTLPQTKLDVSGRITARGVSGNTPGVLELVPFAGNPGYIYKDTGGNLKFETTANNTGLFIGQNNNVGIGLTEPASKLDVSGRIRARGVSGSTSGVLELMPFAGNPGYIYKDTGGNLQFETTVGNTRLFIGQNGNVGIGTNNPSAKLDVNGNVRIGTGSDLLNLELQGTFHRLAFNELRFWDNNNGKDVVTINNDKLTATDVCTTGGKCLSSVSSSSGSGGETISASQMVRYNILYSAGPPESFIGSTGAVFSSGNWDIDSNYKTVKLTCPTGGVLITGGGSCRYSAAFGAIGSVVVNQPAIDGSQSWHFGCVGNNGIAYQFNQFFVRSAYIICLEQPA